MNNDKEFHYTQCGLDYIYLCNGVDFKERDGETFYKIQDVDQLHDAIAHAIITSPSPLCGQELRFLRGLMGLSQESLARHVGRKRDAIAKPEMASHEPINKQLDRLVRFIYIGIKVIPEEMEKVTALMDDIAEEAYQREVDFSYEDGWAQTEKKCA